MMRTRIKRQGRHPFGVGADHQRDRPDQPEQRGGVVPRSPQDPETFAGREGHHDHAEHEGGDRAELERDQSEHRDRDAGPDPQSQPAGRLDRRARSLGEATPRSARWGRPTAGPDRGLGLGDEQRVRSPASAPFGSGGALRTGCGDVGAGQRRGRRAGRLVCLGSLSLRGPIGRGEAGEPDSFAPGAGNLGHRGSRRLRGERRPGDVVVGALRAHAPRPQDRTTGPPRTLRPARACPALEQLFLGRPLAIAGRLARLVPPTHWSRRPARRWPTDARRTPHSLPRCR